MINTDRIPYGTNPPVTTNCARRGTCTMDRDGCGCLNFPNSTADISAGRYGYTVDAALAINLDLVPDVLKGAM